MKMRYFIVSLSLICSFLSSFGEKNIIVDALDGSLIEGATILGESGLILGLSDENGRINEPPANQYPISIRNVGYEPTILEKSVDTIRLVPAVYSLNEIVINPNERPIKRVICFAREYATGATNSDTLQFYSEYMLESFLKDADKKVKGYKSGDASPKVRNKRQYARITNAQGLDSVARPKDDDEITLLSWKEMLEVPDYKFHERKEISEGAKGVAVMGKYGPAYIFRKQNDIYSMTTDHLSEYKDHKWSPLFLKLLGMTIDADNMQSCLAYKVNDSGDYSFDDFIYSTYSIHLLAKGKLFKKIFHTDQPIEMDTYIELYPISMTYITPEEYKELRAEKQEIPFQEALNQQPLPEGVKKIIERIENRND